MNHSHEATTEHSSSTALAVIEPDVYEGEVVDAADIKDAHRIDAEFVDQIHDKTVDFIEEYNPTVVDGNKVELSPEAEKDFESMFIDELVQRLADGSLKERELSEASVVPEVFADGWQRDGVSYEISSEKLKNIAAMTSCLVKAFAVLDHVVPSMRDGSAEDKNDSADYVRVAATAKAASKYIDGADYYIEKLDAETANKVREAMVKIDERALKAWPKMGDHPVGEIPMRWL